MLTEPELSPIMPKEHNFEDFNPVNKLKLKDKIKQEMASSGWAAMLV